jgi:hypothetical protein
VPDAADQVPLECTAGFTRSAAFLLSTSHVGLSRSIAALLGESDQVQEHVQTAVAAPAKTMTHLTRAGGLNWRDTGQDCDLRYAEAWSRHAQLGDQAGGNNGLHALNRQQRHEVFTHASLDIAAELALLVHKQSDLLGDLAHGSFTDTLELANAGAVYVQAACTPRRLRSERIT